MSLEIQYLYEKNQRIKELENKNKKLQEKVHSLEHNVEVLAQAVLHAAASSKKMAQIYGQCLLFAELIYENQDEAENKVINIKEHKKTVCKICRSKLETIGKKK